MTKQFSAEPSMEDILASIRKMISEERMGPRPIPDQIGRSPFGESVAEAPAAEPARAAPRPERTEPSGERSAPSFSSLSDALKSAAPMPEQRLTLEEKIADMLERREAPSRQEVLPDPLAVFAAKRPSSAPTADPNSFGAIPRSTVPERPAAERRTPERPIDRSAPERAAPERPSARQTLGVGDERATELPRSSKPAPRLPEAPLNGAAPGRDQGAMRRPTGTSPATAKVESSTGAGPNKADAQRIIAMPPRNGAAGPAGPAGLGVNGNNGTNVSSLGLNAFAGGHRLRDADTPENKSLDAKKGAPDNGATAKSADSFKPKTGESITRTKASDAVAGAPTKAGRSEAVKTAPAGTPRPGAEAAKPADARPENTSSKAAPQPVTAKPTNAGGPSDALVDAVVALVHKEPDALSVFTSGAAFVSGVTGDDPVRKPGPNVARKLDRSAAELLRPMLRQWLSDNMPRIVEEALRSELMSSQSPPKGSQEK